MAAELDAAAKKAKLEEKLAGYKASEESSSAASSPAAPKADGTAAPAAGAATGDSPGKDAPGAPKAPELTTQQLRDRVRAQREAREAGARVKAQETTTAARIAELEADATRARKARELRAKGDLVGAARAAMGDDLDPLELAGAAGKAAADGPDKKPETLDFDAEYKKRRDAERAAEVEAAKGREAEYWRGYNREAERVLEEHVDKLPRLAAAGLMSKETLGVINGFLEQEQKAGRPTPSPSQALWVAENTLAERALPAEAHAHLTAHLKEYPFLEDVTVTIAQVSQFSRQFRQNNNGRMPTAKETCDAFEGAAKEAYEKQRAKHGGGPAVPGGLDPSLKQDNGSPAAPKKRESHREWLERTERDLDRAHAESRR